MRFIPLSRGLFAIVDDRDYAKISRFTWTAVASTGTFYARRTFRRHGREFSIYMHRQILNVPAGMLTDHKNHFGLDNRNRNLRIASKAQNSQNRNANRSGASRYKGVSWIRKSRKWGASIKDHGKAIWLGSYASEAEAARAYDRRASQLFRAFAKLNFPRK